MKKFLLTLMSLILMAVLVGCGSSTSSTDTSSSDSAEKDLASITEEVKTKIKDGESDVTKDVQDALDTDSDLVGTWKATDATVSDTQKGNYDLKLDEDTKYTEDITYTGTDASATTPNESFSGVYLVKDNAIALLPDKATVNGEEKTGEALYEPEDYGKTYDYVVDGDKLTLTNPDTKEVIEFTKAS